MKTESVQALFVSSTVNPQTATQVAGDLGIPVITLYVGSLSDAQGPAPSYIEMMRYDVAKIVEALR
jgi:ABC-type Zn uptake system ZnuABC Zn-binding protein ZnuA